MQWNASIIIIILAAILTLALIYMIFRKDKGNENYQPESPAPLREQPKDSYSLVFFHLNGCGPCKQFRPEWEKFKTISPPDLNLYELEASHPETSKFKITGFPTVKFFKGEPSPDKPSIDFTGARTAEGLSKFVEETLKRS